MSISEVMDSTIKRLNDEYIEYKYFVDLLMLRTGACYREIASLLLNKNFNQSIDIYSIDNAFRVKKLEDKKFLEDMLEDLLSDKFLDHYDESSNINRLPQKAIEEHYIECLMKKADILEFSYIKEFDIKLSGEEYLQGVTELYDDRNYEFIKHRRGERGNVCDCFKTIRTQRKINLDEVACMMSSECYCHIHFVEGHIDYSCCSNEFWRCKNFLQQEHESGNLVSDLENKLFSNNYIQRYLYKNGFIIEGHNQGMAIPAVEQEEPKTNEQLISDFREHIKQLTADNNNLKEQLSNAYVELETAETYQSSFDEKKLFPNSQAKVACMLYAVLKDNNYDLSAPMGKGLTNDLIVNAAKTHKVSVTRNFVSNWLKRVYQLDIDTNK